MEQAKSWNYTSVEYLWSEESIDSAAQNISVNFSTFFLSVQIYIVLWPENVVRMYVWNPRGVFIFCILLTCFQILISEENRQKNIARVLLNVYVVELQHFLTSVALFNWIHTREVEKFRRSSLLSKRFKMIVSSFQSITERL